MEDACRVLVHRNSDCLHIRLEGEFDEEAAQEIVSTIGANGNGLARVFIHTNGITRVSSVGQEMLHRQFSQTRYSHVSFIFTGEKAMQIAPQGYRVLA